jgi:predicted ATP-grasp superfamily ATP-dependent carboligase
MQKYKVPKIASLSYKESIQSIVDEVKADFLFITNQQELTFFSVSDFPRVAHLTPSRTYISLFNSKFSTYKALQEIDAQSVPHTIKIDCYKDLVTFMEYNDAAWLRDSLSQAATSAILVTHENIKLIKSWMKFKRLSHLTASKYLPGRNLAWTALYKDSELICSTLHERLSYMNSFITDSGITGVANDSVTLIDKKLSLRLETLIGTLCEKIGEPLSGIITVDLKGSEENVDYVTEINPRPTNTIHLTYAGCNFPLNLIDAVIGKLNLEDRHCACTAGVRYIRGVDVLPFIGVIE